MVNRFTSGLVFAALLAVPGSAWSQQPGITRAFDL
jgi:hypothetical protein